MSLPGASIPAGSEEQDSKGSKYGSSCTNCRRRKQRCDGQSPTCGRCGKTGETCLYERYVCYMRHLLIARNARRLTTNQLYAIHHATNRFLRSLAASTDASADDLRAKVAAWLDRGNDAILEQNTMSATTDSMSQDRTTIEATDPSHGSNSVKTSVHKQSGDGDGLTQTGGDHEGEESGAAEVDELLMQMSINQEGQVRATHVHANIRMAILASLLFSGKPRPKMSSTGCNHGRTVGIARALVVDGAQLVPHPLYPLHHRQMLRRRTRNGRRIKRVKFGSPRSRMQSRMRQPSWAY